MKRILAIDVGTQSCRASLFTVEGELLDMEKVVYQVPYISPCKGWAERAPEDYWRDLCRATRALLDRDGTFVDAVCVTTQRATVVFLDGELKPVRRAILWLDQRIAEKVPSLGAYRLLFSLVGAGRVVDFFQRKAPTNWVAHHQPEVWEKTRYVLLLSGYINLRLTGLLKDSVACQVGYLPFNFKKRRWDAPNSWKYKALSLAPHMLCELVEPGEVLGHVSRDASRDTGIPEGVPVIAGASDKSCEILGCGAGREDAGYLSYGTTATFSVNSPRYFEPFRFSSAYPSGVKGWYDIEYQVFRGFWLVTWFKEQFAKLEAVKAERLGLKPEELLEELALEVPPGSMGLLLQPYWSPGVRYPGLDARGCIVGFTDVHKKEHMYRALIEGLIYALRVGKERIENKGVKIKRLYMAGGGATSFLVARCTADIMGLPVVKPRYTEASSLGAAVLAAVGIGIYPNALEASSRMASDGENFFPDPGDMKVYQYYYKHAFKPLWKRLKGIYKKLNAFESLHFSWLSVKSCQREEGSNYHKAL